MRGFETGQPVRLLDLVRAVQDAAVDDREVVAVLHDLLNSPRRERARARRPPPRARRRLIASLLAFALLAGAGSVRADETESATDPNVPSETTPVSAADENTGYTFLPTRPLFDPLIADPRWPRFAAEYQAYHDDAELRNVGSIAFGGLLPILQGPLPSEGRFEVGLQAGVFSIFDLDGESFDLINSDFWAGIPFTVKWGAFSTMLRVYHQSSHLGDEFLLREEVDRVNLSYEAIDLIPALELGDWGRIYGGAGWLFDVDPRGLERWYVQAGGSVKSPVAFWGWLRPIAALDVKKTAEQDWSTDWSVKFGFQFENEKVFKGRQLLLLGGYYKGNSPNGQFFSRRIEFWSVGMQFYF